METVMELSKGPWQTRGIPGQKKKKQKTKKKKQNKTKQNKTKRKTKKRNTPFLINHSRCTQNLFHKINDAFVIISKYIFHR